MSETSQRSVVYIVLAVAVFASAIAAYAVVSAQSGMVSVTREMGSVGQSIGSVAESISSQTNTISQAMSAQTNTITQMLQEDDPDEESEEDEEENVITVVGLGYKNIPPDMINLNIGIDTLAETAQEAIQKNSETMNNVLDALKALGLEEKEVRTSYFSVYPQYSYDPEGKQAPKITGYQATNNVNIVTKQADKAAEIIDTAISAGANRVDGPWFSTSPDIQKELRGELVEMAMNDAEEKAGFLLESQNLSIKGIKSISISEGGQPIIFLERAVARESAQAQLQPTPYYYSPPPVLPGEQQVSVTVAVTYIVE